MAEAAEPIVPDLDVQEKTQRTRPRIDSIKVNRDEIFHRVKEFYDTDYTAITIDRDVRLQRYAKYRMWTEGKDWPWADSSDIKMPDMMEKSLRVQDTIHNAVMSQTPPITSAASTSVNKDKQDSVDNLIQYQVFVEQNGEEVIGDLADAFVNDGVYTAFIPWVKEKREVVDIRIFSPIPEGALPQEHFQNLLNATFPKATILPRPSGWDFMVRFAEANVPSDREWDAAFYTQDNGSVELVVKKMEVVYDGPKIIVKDYEDVLCPTRAQNLQMPGPSNPNGASHVILVDRPTTDEVTRLYKSGFYDLMTEDDVKTLHGVRRNESEDQEKDQKDALDGKSEESETDKVSSHNRVTRLTCFDSFDIDGDGIDEDVIFWCLLEPKITVKAKMLTEMYPSNPPRRPLVSSSMLPIRGRRNGIGLLEILEGIHDAMKTAYDQMVDAGTIANAPFFFYRAASTVKPEIIALSPGEGYPLADPSRDVFFPNINNNASAFGLNLITVLQQFEEKVSMIGDIQLGRVPTGKSSALRTVGGMALLSGQGESRPERILRRFFIGLSEIWAQIHELNRTFLPRNKQIRILGPEDSTKDPYQTIDGAQAIEGRFDFSFKANVLNTSKQQLQGALEALMSVYVSDLAMQLGIVQPDGLYRLLRDYGKALGQEPLSYLTPPTPTAEGPRLMAEEAMLAIMQGQMPKGAAEEPGGAAEHFQKLQAYMESDDFGHLDATEVVLFKNWFQEIAQQAQLEQQQAQLAQAAQQFGNGQQAGGQPGRPAENPPQGDQGNPPVNGGELLDESLPGAGGGGNQ